MKLNSKTKLKFLILLFAAIFINCTSSSGVNKIPESQYLSTNLSNKVKTSTDCKIKEEVHSYRNTIIYEKNLNIQADSCSEILLLDGTTIFAVILEVSSSQIKYKKCDRQYSPLYIIDNSKVEKITYPDGAEDLFNNNNEEEIEKDKPLPPQPGQMFEQSMKKAAHNYLYESQEVTYDKYVYIYFKNGKSDEGDLVKEKVDKYIQIQTASGQINTYKMSDIDHIDYETKK